MATRAPFPLSHGVPRVDDRCVSRGIVAVIRDGFRWNDALNAEGRHKTLSNRVGRWRRLGVCQRINQSVYPGTCQTQSSSKTRCPTRLMIAASHVTAHRPGDSVRQKGGSAESVGQQVECIPSAMRFAMALAVRSASP